jgi:uncharacterized membrane protein YhaH (DUF805 family)
MERLKPGFKFRGRLGRVGYWRGYLKLSIAVALVWLIALFATIAVGRWAIILFTPLAPMFVASCSLVVRRLHDRNKSAWWLVGFLTAPGLLLELYERLPHAPRGITIAMLVVILAFDALLIWFWLEIGFFRGTQGPNRFGQDVLTPGGEAPA